MSLIVLSIFSVLLCLYPSVWIFPPIISLPFVLIISLAIFNFLLNPVLRFFKSFFFSDLEFSRDSF